MRILVTGSDGQLGRSLTKVSGLYPNFTIIPADLPAVDITSAASVGEIISRTSPDLIVNCAAYTAVDKAETERENAMRVNADGPRILAAQAAAKDIPLVHISTDYVFDGTSSTPLTETSATSPAGVYGQTKLLGEQAVLESGCRGAIIRTSWLYSEFGGNFVKTMLRLGKERPRLEVVFDQTGTPTYATDLARAILDLAQKGFGRAELFHYSNEGVASWYDLAQETFRIAALSPRVEAVTTDRFPTPARRPAYSVLSKEKIKGHGIEVPYWRDSLAHCLDIILNEI